MVNHQLITQVLLLDEATSALDSESEQQVQAAIDSMMDQSTGGKSNGTSNFNGPPLTAVVVAHRLSTVRRAHKICLLQNGVVAEEGTYDELQKKGG